MSFNPRSFHSAEQPIDSRMGMIARSAWRESLRSPWIVKVPPVTAAAAIG